MPRPEDFDRVGDLLGEVCQGAVSPPTSTGGTRRVQSPDDPQARRFAGSDTRALAQVWPEIAGADVAANATPAQLKGGRLVVTTSSSVWAHTLQYMSEDLMARINDRLGPGVVTRIVFRHAGWEERPLSGHKEPVEYQAGAHQSPGTLTEEQKKAIADLSELDLPAAIREKMTSAMRAAFARDQQGPVR